MGPSDVFEARYQYVNNVHTKSARESYGSHHSPKTVLNYTFIAQHWRCALGGLGTLFCVPLLFLNVLAFYPMYTWLWYGL